MRQGCRAAGYRLTGAELEHVCCRHLYGSDRMLTAWPASDHAVILAIGPHDRSVADVYDLLLAALAIDVPIDERTKPPCCDELGEPPRDHAVADVLADALEALTLRPTPSTLACPSTHG
ncbi:MAG TPA: hypothetical protein VNG13_14625 [Mycobacteriales bacterium]|nr:hypothetical protein [Mycobacteriales bacterium]